MIERVKKAFPGLALDFVVGLCLWGVMPWRPAQQYVHVVNRVGGTVVQDYWALRPFACSEFIGTNGPAISDCWGVWSAGLGASSNVMLSFRVEWPR